MLKSMLIYKDFQIWYLISHQSIRGHVKEFLLTNMEYNMTLINNPQP